MADERHRKVQEVFRTRSEFIFIVHPKRNPVRVHETFVRLGAIFLFACGVTTTFLWLGPSPIFGARYDSGRAEARKHISDGPHLLQTRSSQHAISYLHLHVLGRCPLSAPFALAGPVFCSTPSSIRPPIECLSFTCHVLTLSYLCRVTGFSSHTKAVLMLVMLMPKPRRSSSQSTFLSIPQTSSLPQLS